MKIPSIITSRVSDILAREERPKSSFSSIPKLFRGSLTSLVVLASVSFLPIPSYASPDCSAFGNIFWNTINEITGTINFESEERKYLNNYVKRLTAVTKIIRFGVCYPFEKEDILLIAGKAIDARKLEDIDAYLERLNSKLEQDNDLTEYDLDDNINQLETYEDDSAVQKIEMLPVQVTLGALKLTLVKEKLRRALVTLPTDGNHTRTSSYYNQALDAFSAINITQRHLNKTISDFDAELAKFYWKAFTEIDDEGAMWSIAFIYDNHGGRYPGYYSMYSTDFEKWWEVCGKPSGCNKGANEAKAASKTDRHLSADDRLTARILEVRGKVINQAVLDVVADLKNAVVSLTNQLNKLNVARNGRAWQSSTNSPHDAARAVDGRAAGEAYSMTTSERNPWWEVALPRAQGIETVAFHSFLSRGWGSFKVEILDRKQTNVATVVATTYVPYSTSGEYTASFRKDPYATAAAYKGNCVKISLSGVTEMNLREVYVFGTNIAQGMFASQSSTLNKASADRANDGCIDGDYNNGSVSHTGLMQKPWWRVDLDSKREIGDVLVYNRTGAGRERLTNFTVSVLKEDGTVEAKKTLTGWGGDIAKFSFFGAWGSQVQIQLNGAAPNYLNLAEVIVLRKADSQ